MLVVRLDDQKSEQNVVKILSTLFDNLNNVEFIRNALSECVPNGNEGVL